MRTLTTKFALIYLSSCLFIVSRVSFAQSVQFPGENIATNVKNKAQTGGIHSVIIPQVYPVYYCSVPNFAPEIVVEGVTIQKSKLAAGMEYFFHPSKATDVIIRLRLNFYKSPQDAFVHLQEMLSYCSAPLPLPSSKEFGFDIGDCCFFGHPHGSFKAVWFIRNNVVVSMRSSVDIVNVAKCLDRQILSLSTNSLPANP